MKKKMRVLREQLDKLVQENASFKDVYRLSVRLDSWIVLYYKNVYFRIGHGHIKGKKFVVHKSA